MLRATLAFLFILSLTPCLAKETQGDPYIVHVSDTPPGYTMVISGGGYNPKTVEVLIHYPGGEVKDREQLPALIADMAQRYDGTPPPLPRTPPDFQTYTVKPLHATERSVFVPFSRFRRSKQFPPGATTAIVYLKEGDRLSNPIAVNRATGWWLLKTVSQPGEINRIYGFNLQGDPFVPNYVFLRSMTDGKTIELPQVKRHHEDGVSENYHIQFQIPVSVKPGKYLVFAHSNSGGIHGLTEALPLTITTKPAFPQRFFNAGDHDVKGDSFTDDLPALQELMDHVGQQGGGIIYLPAGQYRLNGTLQIAANVILRGAGRDNTILFYGNEPAAKIRYRWLISARNVDRTGLEDLTVRVSHPMTLAVSYFKNDRGPTYDSHILGCRFVGGKVSAHNHVHMEIGHSVFEEARLQIKNIDHGWIHKNEFTMGPLRHNPFIMWASQYTSIEHNRISRSKQGFVWQIHGNFGHYRNFIDANEVEVTRMSGNAGETFLFEGAGFKWWGKPDRVTDNGFEVNNSRWKAGSLRHAFAVVTNGRGLGQYVRIADNTQNRVILEKPWAILPSGDVYISILHGVVENVLTNNREVDADNSMMFFGAGAINNRIERYRSENGLGITVWSRAEIDKEILIPDYFNIFDGNVIEDQGSFWLTRRGDIGQKIGVRNLNNIFRRNFISDPRRKHENQYRGKVWDDKRSGNYRPVQSAFWMDIGRYRGPDLSHQTPIWIDTLIEKNHIIRADWGIELREIAGGTVVHRNTFFDVKLPIITERPNGNITKNHIEMPVLKNPLPWGKHYREAR